MCDRKVKKEEKKVRSFQKSLHNLKFVGQHSLSGIASPIWNSLPASLQNLLTLSAFNVQLKTLQFQPAFPQILVDHVCMHLYTCT